MAEEKINLKGKQVGNYELGEEIGHGGFSVVYEARHNHLSNMGAAVKTPANYDKSQIDRIKREASFLDELVDVPHVLRARDYMPFPDGNVPDVPYLFTERCDTSLRKLIDEHKRIEWRTAVELTMQALEGLAGAHAKGKVHADLKPSNILLNVRNGKYDVKIGDWGSATTKEGNLSNTMLQSMSMDGDSARDFTLPYTTPEHLARTRIEITSASDMHQVGQILYEMISGVTYRETDGRLTLTDFKAPKWVDEGVKKATSPYAVQRPSALECLNYLKQGLEGKFDGPTLGERVGNGFRRTTRKISGIGKKARKIGAYSLIPIAALTPIWAPITAERVAERKTRAVAEAELKTGTFGCFQESKLYLIPLKNLLDEDRQVFEYDLQGWKEIVEFDNDNLIFVGSSPLGESIYKINLKTNERESLIDLAREENKWIKGRKLNGTALAETSEGVKIVTRIAELDDNWYEAKNGTLEKISLDKETEMRRITKIDIAAMGKVNTRDIPGTSLTLVHDYFCMDWGDCLGVEIKRRDRFWGDLWAFEGDVQTPFVSSRDIYIGSEE